MSSRISVASAGAGKTTELVADALKVTEGRILVTTYTNESLENLREEMFRQYGCIPANVDLITWYSFLLLHGVRPYQNLISNRPAAKSILFDRVPLHAARTKRADVDKYYFTEGGHIYRDRVSDFVAKIDDETGGLIIQRLNHVYSHIFLDELQDVAGYDLDLLEKIMRSSIPLIAVGDPRQATYSTHNARKHKAYGKAKIFDWIREKEREGLVAVTEKCESRRCNQEICDFADALFPDMPTTNSRNDTVTGHDGIFFISRDEVADYAAKYAPQVLQWDRRADTADLRGMNIGVSKGRSFDRVLIFPTEPMRAYLKHRDPTKGGRLEQALCGCDAREIQRRICRLTGVSAKGLALEY